MFKLHSIAGRVAVGMSIGVILGLLIMGLAPSFNMPVVSMFGLGTLLMFMLMGAFIGLIGIFDRHPVFDFKMAWWIRGIIGGILFMLMYIFLSYDMLTVIIQSELLSWMGFRSPFWALLDGLFIGMLMAYIEMMVAGDEKNLPVK
jgi:hypothetical protein